MNTARTVSTYRPLQGSVASMRAAAAVMASFGAFLQARHLRLPAGAIWLAQCEDAWHPGEGSA